jgi:hypothetical protein
MMRARSLFLRTLPSGAPTTARVDAEDGYAFYAGFHKVCRVLRRWRWPVNDLFRNEQRA